MNRRIPEIEYASLDFEEMRALIDRAHAMRARAVAVAARKVVRRVSALLRGTGARRPEDTRAWDRDVSAVGRRAGAA